MKRPLQLVAAFWALNYAGGRERRTLPGLKRREDKDAEQRSLYQLPHFPKSAIQSVEMVYAQTGGAQDYPPAASPLFYSATRPSADAPATAPNYPNRPSGDYPPVGAPVVAPVFISRDEPSDRPSASPSASPSAFPTVTDVDETPAPSASPTSSSSARPSRSPSSRPSRSPSSRPSSRPSLRPSSRPSSSPSARPSATPSQEPTTPIDTDPPGPTPTSPRPTPFPRPKPVPKPVPKPRPKPVPCGSKKSGKKSCSGSKKKGGKGGGRPWRPKPMQYYPQKPYYPQNSIITSVTFVDGEDHYDNRHQGW